MMVYDFIYLSILCLLIVIPYHSCRVKVNTQTTAAFLDAIRANVNPELQLVITILPTKKKDLYDAIKKQCCLNTPVINQCITFGLLRDDRKRRSAVLKIAIQIQCKLGAEPWAVKVYTQVSLTTGDFCSYLNSDLGQNLFVQITFHIMTKIYTKVFFLQ